MASSETTPETNTNQQQVAVPVEASHVNQASQMKQAPPPQVAVLPSGEMVFLSPENPYAMAYSGMANGIPQCPDPSQPQMHMQQPQQQLHGIPPGSVAIPPSILNGFQRPLALERMARVVRILAMIDMFFSLLLIVNGAYIYALTAIMAYCGYAGARTFRRVLTRVYLVYLVMTAVVNVTFTVCMLSENLSDNTVEPSMAVFRVLTALMQLFIAQFVWKFYQLLPTSDDEAYFLQHVLQQRTHIV